MSFLKGNKVFHLFRFLSFIEKLQDVPFVLHFHLSADKDKHEEIYQAYLWLHMKATFRNKITISVTSKHHPDDLSVEGETVNMKVFKGGWFRVYLPMLTGKALSVGEENIYLELKCRDCQNLFMMDNIIHDRRPFLALKVRNKQEESRTRRHVTECTGDIDICCRKRFYISFKDIGWSDWIISPKGYIMNLCEGRCPVHLGRAPGISASSHTAVFSLIKANNIYSNLSLCCVPTKRRSLSILYYDVNNTIVKADVPDMIVESCGCT
ncbi:inhibin beta E chain-like [Rana temporaria]|uniref:inhibin beta E chain-like n=1 Tax=Rana temporaria TaxID=8407 RepID=UPI001AAD8209|nr:inhibin beta E chain-like [Rana temporaria]